MKLYLYGLKNRLSGLFERPVAEIYDPKEYGEYLTQSLALAGIPELNRYKEYDVFCLGCMETKSGEIVGQVDFIVSLDAMCTAYIAAKKVEAVPDGNGKEQAGA